VEKKGKGALWSDNVWDPLGKILGGWPAPGPLELMVHGPWSRGAGKIERARADIAVAWRAAARRARAR